MSSRSRKSFTEYYRLLNHKERDLMATMLSDLQHKLQKETDSTEKTTLQSAINSINRELEADRQGFIAWQKTYRRLERNRARSNEE